MFRSLLLTRDPVYPRQRSRRIQTFAVFLLLESLAVLARAQAVPDLSGAWQRVGRGGEPGEGQTYPALALDEPPLTSWGRERYELAKPLHGPRTARATESNAPELVCLPMGFPATYFRPRPFEILQLPGRVVMLFEIDNFWRVIHMDGREFPSVPLHTWNGYSIGRYEGDTLVIETRHMVGWEPEAQRWIDRLGYPFSDEIHVVERIRRLDANTLENVVTIDDPVAYERPWSGTIVFERRAFELAEFVCGELMLSELPAMRPGGR